MTAANTSLRSDSPWYQANLAALAARSPALFARISEHIPAPGSAEKYTAGEPWPGSAAHLETVPPDAQGLVVFLGLGMGYGPLLILQERREVRQIVILEPSLDLFRVALERVDLRPLFAAERVHFYVGEIDWEQMQDAVTRVASLEDTHILRHLPSFQREPERYGAVNDRAYMILNHINASGSTTRTCGPIFMDNRLAILTLLRHAKNLDALRNRFAGKPAILVAAGPSLTRSLPDLRRAVGRCVLIAADSAVAPLLKAGITPDFITTLDYLDLNFEKLAPFLQQEWPSSLVTTVKATPLVPARFPAKHLFLAFADDQPQKWIMEALGIRTVAAIASSVAHMSLGLALILGCGPIVFVGQDLSYTNPSGDHAEGTVIMRDDMPQDREFFQRPAVGGGTVTTDRQLLSLLKIFEDILEAEPHLYINATAAGLRIKGTIEIPLAEAVGRYCQTPLPVREEVDAAIASDAGFRVDQFIRAGRTNLQSVRSTAHRLAETIALTERIQREVAALPGSSRAYAHFSALPKSLQHHLADFDRINGIIDRDEATWTQVLELTFGMLSDNDQQLARNRRLKETEGYFPWLSAELDRIQSLNRDRVAVLTRYGQELERLLDHLDTEGALMASRPGSTPRELLELHLAARNYALVRRVINEMPPAERNEAKTLLRSGEAKAGMLDFAAAHADWEQAAVLDAALDKEVAAITTNFVDAWLGFVERYGNAGEQGDNFPHLLPTWLGRVRELIARLDELPPRLAQVWQQHQDRCEAWLDADKTDLAECTLQGWLALSERLPEAAFMMARIRIRQEDPPAAIAALADAIRLRPDQDEWLALLARQLLKAQRYDEAIATLTRAVALNPQHALIWGEIGDLLRASDDFANALLAYERCFLALPHHNDALCRMGDCYLATRQKEAAIAAYEATLRADPNHPDARLGLQRATTL